MQNHRIDRAQMKLDAKGAMHVHKPSVYLITLVFLIITYILEVLSTKLQFPGMRLSEISAAYFDGTMMDRAMAAMLENRSTGASLLSVAISIMDAFLSAGFMLFCLNVARREEAGFGTLFDLFAYFFRFLWLEILTGIFILLWSLLLVIPGVIAAYRYSMAVYIFFDDPEKGTLQCIRESKEMTRGYKGQLFVLDLSFIGWAILSIIPFVSIFTMPYMMIARANYYRCLSDRPFVAQQQQQTYDNDPWNQ